MEEFSLGKTNRTISWTGLILVFLLLVGVFLRTYNFHDWLRFNADQSRDASVVSDYFDHKQALPLLGPKAGGTDFRVGPAFYYFQIISAKLFGNYPDKMAYPDLFFSILAIPLLFLFLRKYFDVRTALLLVAIFCVSLYAIKYSRFAWNPNSLPFWSLLFLYGLHEIMLAKENRWIVWSFVTGAAIGIGIQLHSLSLLLFPILAIGVFGYLLYERKKDIRKIIFVVIFTALVFNIPQIVSEIRTGGTNMSAFFDSIGSKEKKGNGLVVNMAKNVICFSQSSAYILSSYDSSDTCELKSVARGWNVLASAFGALIFLGGFVLAIRYARREENIGKKYFLVVLASYVALSFLILIPLANEISMRFYLIMVFMPFVFFGLWLRYLTERFPKNGFGIAVVFAFLLVIANSMAVQKSFAANAAYLTDSDAGMDNVLLKEVEISSTYIVAQSAGAKTVSVGGDAQYLFKALKSMQYFTGKSGIKLVQKSKKNGSVSPQFLIENTRQTDAILEKNPSISNYESFGRFTIFSLKGE